MGYNAVMNLLSNSIESHPIIPHKGCSCLICDHLPSSPRFVLMSGLLVGGENSDGTPMAESRMSAEEEWVKRRLERHSDSGKVNSV